MFCPCSMPLIFITQAYPGAYGPRGGEVDAGKHRVGTRGEPFPEIT